MMAAASTSLLERLVPSSAAGSRAERGRSWLEAHGLPTAREEAWRYTPVEEIIRALDSAAPALETSGGIGRSQIDRLAGDHGGLRLVYVNGVAVRSLSDTAVETDGLWLGGRHGPLERSWSSGSADDQPVDGFDALNWAAGRDVAVVIVEPDTHIDRPIHVVHVAVPGEAMTATHPRTVVLAGVGSRVHVVESYVGLSGSSVTNASTRIVAGDRSSVIYHRTQDESSTSIHVGRTAIDQGMASVVRATSIMTGGRIARSAIEVRLTGTDSCVDIDGLYLPRHHQRHDNVITVDHVASRCTSTQRFTGVIDDHARGSFSGHVVVRNGTTGTDAHQANRNLVLRPTAQADTRPWLEILADDVRCTHGATVGRLDDEALFYLRSRGIPLDQSRMMLVAAFANDVIDAIPLASLRDRVAAAFTSFGSRA
jgi:Fe-S cluster assembly protein SufD